jgi:hypothetical protein
MSLVGLLAALHLLGRHVARRADHGLRPGQLLEPDRRLRDAEVEDLEQHRTVGLPRDEEVRRLDVAMNDADRVRLCDALARLEHQVDDDRGRLWPVVPEDLVEVVTLQILHHHERRAVGHGPDVDHARDVLVLQLDRRLRLAQEPRDGRRALRHLRQEDLDRDRLRQVLVRRAHHPTHAAGTEDLVDPVLA